MSSANYYKGVIWTNHALSRIGDRGLSKDLVLQAFNHPEQSLEGKNQGTMEYQKHVGKSLVTVIATRNEKNEWIILSCWINPPLPGSIDSKKQEDYKKYKKASFWRKFWLTFKKQLGF